jgi:hypothetical protein
MTTLLIMLGLLLALVQSVYRHKIEPFSFDITKFEYPLEWKKLGTTVALKKTIKVLPKVKDRYGGLFLDQPVETNSFEVMYKMDVLNEENTVYKKVDGHTVDDIEGFAIWYLTHEPGENDMRPEFGYRSDFNGLGVFVFKHEGKWRI